MASIKISGLTELPSGSVAPTADYLPIVDTSATQTKKVTPDAIVVDALAQTTTKTINGPTVISVTDNATAALRVTQLGTANAIRIEDSTNPDSTPFVVDASGRVIIGAANSFVIGGAEAALQNYGVSGFQTNYRFSADAAGPNFTLGKSRSSTTGVSTIVQNGDSLATIVFSGADGTSYTIAATITAQVDGVPGVTDMPGRLVFSTTSDGTSTSTERLRIDSTGFTKITGSLGIGAPVTKTADFTIASTENYLINNKAAASCTVTLPAAASFSGRMITILNYQAFTVVSASLNVVPITGGAAGTAIIAATAGKWVELVSDGTNWLIMKAN